MTDFIAPAPGAHGGDGRRLAVALGVPIHEILDLSLSINPCAPDISESIRRHARAATSYPEVGGPTAALARVLEVEESRLVLTNGGAEAIALVAAEFPIGDVDGCDFSLYARHLEEIEAGARRWRSNPHNPTGRLAPDDEGAAVWDEAFYPLATGTWSRRDPDSIVVGSLTKVFACPGLRVGYVVAPDAHVADRIRARQPRWAVNGVACAVLPELLGSADLPRWAASVAELRRGLEEVLRTAGLEPDPSDANFVLVRDARGVRDALAAHGVLVRDTASFGIPDGIRIAVPGPAELDRLSAALEELPHGAHRS
jgi:histidinol-phosphate/aromatic aminotransferase/cobyric acid decarboxylase-like protein